MVFLKYASLQGPVFFYQKTKSRAVHSVSISDRKQTVATGLLRNGRMFPDITQLRVYFLPEMFIKCFPSLRRKAQGSGRACVEFSKGN